MGTVGSTVALAGCNTVGDSGESSDGSSTETTDESSDGSSTETIDESSNRTPPETVELYFRAMEESDVDAVNNLLHESVDPVSEQYFGRMPITILDLETEEVTVDEIADSLNQEPETVQADIDELLEELGADDYMMLSYSVTYEQDGQEDTLDSRVRLVEDDGTWLLLQRL